MTLGRMILSQHTGKQDAEQIPCPSGTLLFWMGLKGERGGIFLVQGEAEQHFGADDNWMQASVNKTVFLPHRMFPC